MRLRCYAFVLPVAALLLGSGCAVVKVKERGFGEIAAERSADAINSGRLSSAAGSALASLAESATPAAVILASSADGKEIAGRLAVRLGSGVLADVVDGCAHLEQVSVHPDAAGRGHGRAGQGRGQR